MNFFKKLFSKKTVEEPQVNTNIPDFRIASLAICNKAGFKPAKSLPTGWDRQLRPTIEIAKRLNAIKALVLWLMVPADNLSDERILNFVDQNGLRVYMEEDEEVILTAQRNDAELRNAIGWKFENAWPLAWYFGYTTPEISGEMMTGEQMQEILINYTCPLENSVEEWAIQQEKIISEEEVIKKEDLFYCLHNAVRSAQLGGETVPTGFHPVGNGGVIHERRHSLTWMLSKGVSWEDTDLST